MEPLQHCDFQSGKLVLKLDVQFQAHLNEAVDVVDRIMNIVRDMKCAAGSEFEIELALREAVVNAVVHGCKGDPEKMVECCVACDEGRGLLIIVRDPGPGFDPASLPSPIVGQNLFASHGRGIYLINQLMDEVTFKRGGTEIHMRKK